MNFRIINKQAINTFIITKRTYSRSKPILGQYCIHMREILSRHWGAGILLMLGQYKSNKVLIFYNHNILFEVFPSNTNIARMLSLY